MVWFEVVLQCLMTAELGGRWLPLGDWAAIVVRWWSHPQGSALGLPESILCRQGHNREVECIIKVRHL